MKTATGVRVALLVAVGTVSLCAGTPPAPCDPCSGAVDSTRVIPNDNRTPAGRLERGVLSVRLVARVAFWKPEGADGPELPIYAFAEEGGPPRIPAPLLRVPVGTEIRMSIRNALPQALRVFGLQDRPADKPDTLYLGPGKSAEVRFRVGEPGTYLYSARTSSDTFAFGQTEDGQLSGALIVDSAGASRPPADRVFVIGLWAAREWPPGTPIEKREEALVVNGLSWPHTERLTHTVGDTVHWRVLNASRRGHPMHLHGFYYRVESRGTALRDTAYAESVRRKVVTERMTPGTTMAMTWSPHTAGNWLFHCHIVIHISGRIGPRPAHDINDPHMNHALHGMSGLVLGINVRPRPGERVTSPLTPARRTLRLFATERPGAFGAASAYGYVLQEGEREPAADSVRLPGSPIVLTRGEPTAVTVVNRMREPVTVHWHGIELESIYDGVGDWSGWRGGIARAIPPGDSFVVRMTPHKAGTFIYHTHQSEHRQLAAGLYGPLLVLEPGATRDTLTDHILLMGTSSPLPDAQPNLNGQVAPAPLELSAGATHRLRFINITPGETKIVRLVADTVVQRWRAIGKDGAELPPHQATSRPARVIMGAGETWDFEYSSAEPRELALEIVTLRGVRPPIRTVVPVHVRA